MSEAVTPRSASTILLVRDAPDLQVLMVTRHHQIDFATGALVFPGGKRAAEDSDPAWLEHVDASGDLSPDELSLRIAGVREAFEESGVLLARLAGRRGAGAPFAPAQACAALSDRRDAVASGAQPFLPLVREAGLVLALDALVRYAHWVTPEFVPKRFDTHFFIAEAPADQAAACDGREAVEAVWIEPAQALAEGQAGQRQIIFPTRLNLQRLSESPSAAAAMAASRARRIVTVMPRVIEDNGARYLSIPEEAGYAVTRELMAAR
ncbi:MAG: NUDIX hydrolase [Hyphomonadaceae bacterium]